MFVSHFFSLFLACTVFLFVLILSSSPVYTSYVSCPKSGSVFEVALLKRQHVDSEQEAVTRIGCAGSLTALVVGLRSFRRGNVS